MIIDTNILYDLLRSRHHDCYKAFVPYTVAEETIITYFRYQKKAIIRTNKELGKRDNLFTVSDTMDIQRCLLQAFTLAIQKYGLIVENWETIEKALGIAAATGVDFVDAWIAVNYTSDEVLTMDKRLSSILSTSLSKQLCEDFNMTFGEDISEQVAARVLYLADVHDELRFIKLKTRLIEQCYRYKGE